MSDCCTPKGYRQFFSEKNARAEAKRYGRKGLDGTSRRIAEVLKEQGVEGKTLLEVGGGIGVIEIELLKAGVIRAVNVELTPTTKIRPANCSTSQGWLIASSAELWISLRPEPKSKPQTSW